MSRRTPTRIQRKIRLLLKKGITQREVAKLTGVSKGTVGKIANPPKKQQKISIVPSCLACHKSEVPELLRIVNDLQELHKLALFSHPLFSGLARRARSSLERISLGSM